MISKSTVFKFFITPIYPYGNDLYYHEIIALAEGLKELGHQVISNVDYWWQPDKNEFLLKGNLEANFDVAIYDYRYVTSFAHLLYRPGYPNFDQTKMHILVDRNDWISPIWRNERSSIFDVILSGNLFTDVSYPLNVKPWAIGLTNRIIEQLNKPVKQNETNPEIGHNFRVPHNMRKYVLDQFNKEATQFPIKQVLTNEQTITEEQDQFYNKASTGRHNPEYFKIINHTLLFLTFGGYYEFKPLAYQPYKLIDKLKRKPYYFYHSWLVSRKKDIAPSVFVFQYDNFRFWEVLYSYSCPINLDCNYWKFLLPETPVEGTHYLGITAFNVKALINKVKNLSLPEIQKIGANGREWVLQHYSPKAQAQRMLKHISEVRKTGTKY